MSALAYYKMHLAGTDNVSKSDRTRAKHIVDAFNAVRLPQEQRGEIPIWERIYDSRQPAELLGLRFQLGEPPGPTEVVTVKGYDKRAKRHVVENEVTGVYTLVDILGVERPWELMTRI